MIQALSSQGFRHMPEAGRAIIRDQAEIGGGALPWADREAFAALMLNWEMRSYNEALGSRDPVIFDRGIPDVIGYLQLSGLPVPEPFWCAVKQRRYATKVFITPPWPEIFEQDEERKQTLDEAVATYHTMIDVYSGLGYNLVEIPRVPVVERTHFIIDRICEQ
nr:AAA family ATPase [Novosphingobium resinovorum]